MAKTKKASQGREKEPPAPVSRHASRKGSAVMEPTPAGKADRSSLSQKQDDDKRFHGVKHDPRFSRMKRKDMRVKLDDRFRKAIRKNMFGIGTKVDKYGRQRQETEGTAKEKALLEEMYENVLVPSDDDVDGDDDDGANEEKAKQQKKKSPEVESVKDGENGSSGQESMSALDQEGNDDTNGSDSEDNDSGDDISITDEEDLDDETVKRGDISYGDETHRIAIVDLDWDHIRAVDIFASLASFVPDSGALRKVTVYPSELGMKRMEIEAKFGPAMFLDATIQSSVTAGRAGPSKETELKGSSESDSESGFENSLPASDDQSYVGHDYLSEKQRKTQASEAVRKYELEKLKYFFAIAEFDSAASALKVYRECDGMEFMRSGNLLDMRFVPDAMNFDRSPRDQAEKVDDDYEPSSFQSQALRQTNVELTWDKEDDKRAVILKKRKFTLSESLEHDLRAYLASSDSESSLDEEEIDKRRGLLLNSVDISNGEAIGKQKDLREEEDMGDMEVTFHTGFEDLGREMLERKAKREQQQDESAWEARLRRMAERKKERNNERKSTIVEVATGSASNKEQATADIDVENDLGFDDPFFLDPQPKSSKQTKKATHLNKKDSESDHVESKKRAQLELLLMDDPLSGKKNADEIENDSDDERYERKKLRMSKKKYEKYKREQKAQAKLQGGLRNAGADAAVKDDFGFDPDVSDHRFSSLFTSHAFSLDPTDPRFKASKSLNEKILAEKNRRLEVSHKGEPRNQERLGAGHDSMPSQDASTDEIKALAIKLKNQTKQRSLRTKNL